eukprot:3936389-Amphidinium_carterae.1
MEVFHHASSPGGNLAQILRMSQRFPGRLARRLVVRMDHAVNRGGEALMTESTLRPDPSANPLHWQSSIG